MKIKSFIYLGLLSLLMWSCEQGYQPLTNSVYFGEAVNENLKKVTIEEDGAKTSVYVSLASPMDCDVTAEIGVSSSVLDEYNKKHGTNYKILPENYYSLENNQCIVKAGELSSSMVYIDIKAFDDKLEVAEKYAIPIQLTKSSDVDILTPSSSLVILCDRIINTYVLYTNGEEMVYDVKEGDNLTFGLRQWTVEFLILSKSFAKNKHILSFSNSSDKQTSNLFARFGEFDHPTDELQFKINHLPFYGPTKYVPNKWYHIAIVNDGSSIRLYQNGLLDLVVDHPEPNAVFDWDKFTLRHQNPGALSEFRIWGVARSQNDIVNNMYAVNPKTEGLLTYWKMDEGSGNIIHDYTSNGRDLKMTRGTWKEQKFPPEK